MADEKVVKESTYNKEYYEKNKEKINARKAKRYREDPEYRRLIMERTAERKKRIAAQKRKERAALGPAARKRGPYKPKKFLIDVDGRDVEVMTVTMGRLAQAFGKSVRTIEMWVIRGLFPEALYRTPRGVRLFTEFQFELLVKAWNRATRKYGQKMMNHRIGSTSFPSDAKEIWEQYPYGIDPATVKEET